MNKIRVQRLVNGKAEQQRRSLGDMVAIREERRPVREGVASVQFTLDEVRPNENDVGRRNVVRDCVALVSHKYAFR